MAAALHSQRSHPHRVCLALDQGTHLRRNHLQCKTAGTEPKCGFDRRTDEGRRYHRAFQRFRGHRTDEHQGGCQPAPHEPQPQSLTAPSQPALDGAHGPAELGGGLFVRQVFHVAEHESGAGGVRATGSTPRPAFERARRRFASQARRVLAVVLHSVAHACDAGPGPNGRSGLLAERPRKASLQPNLGSGSTWLAEPGSETWPGTRPGHHADRSAHGNRHPRPSDRGARPES